jgi:hypothetical protein
MEKQNMNIFKVDNTPEWVLIVDNPTKTVEMCTKVEPGSEYGDNSQRAVGRDINTYKLNSKAEVLDIMAQYSITNPNEIEIPD